MTKKITRIIAWSICIAIICVTLYFLSAVFGNPVSSALAQSTAKKHLQENYSGTDFEIERIGYDLKTGGYYAKVMSPSSQDSYFTIYMDGIGRYKHDTYSSITEGYTTFARLDDEYRALVKSCLLFEHFDVSMDYFELRAGGYYEVFNYTNSNGVLKEYTLWKDYGLDMSTLILDGEYDIRQLGRDHGTLCLYVHDSEVSVERAAELLLALKTHMNEQDVPFHSVELHLYGVRNPNPDGEPNYAGIYSGESITLYEFLYSDIYEDGMIDRVQASWNITQEHYAIQDGLKKESELLVPYYIEIPEE